MRASYATPEEAAEAKKAYDLARSRDPEVRAAQSERNRERVVSDPAYAASRRAATAAWASANPEKKRAQRRADNSARRARLQSALVEHVDADVVWERDGGICNICGEAADPASWELDHVVPLALGGEHSYANTAVSHSSCNRRKGDRFSGAEAPLQQPA